MASAKDPQKDLVITIDGPAASGKSSVSRELARALGWQWLSTGAFYRGLAFAANQEGISPTAETELAKLAKSDIWAVAMAMENTHVIYRHRDVTSEIQIEEIGALASQISRYTSVRAALLEAQRDCAGHGGLVAEGRDCGSVVFPQAKLKIYLTASTFERATRRALEQGGSLAERTRAQKVRDTQDQTRKAAPLQIPDGAHVIDTSAIPLADVIKTVIDLAHTTLKF